jgi:quinol monooxygenase YgiN
MAGAVMTMLDASAALAQNATLFTVTYVEVGRALAASAVPVLRDYRNAGRKDQGNISLDVLQRIDRPNQFAVIGAWVDAKAFEAHAVTAATKQANDKIAPMQAAPSDTRSHVALAVAPAKGGRGSTFAVTHVDVIPPQKDNGVAALKALAEESRKHGGSQRFDVWQQTNRPNHFTVVEAWTSRKAFDDHEMTKEAREFRTKLAAMTGALYDERLYHILP